MGDETPEGDVVGYFLGAEKDTLTGEGEPD